MGREPEAVPGSYALVFSLSQPVSVVVGRLGPLKFTPGYYVYCGSALGPGGVAARVRHHRKISSHPHWHLDYLRPYLTLLEVWFCYGNSSQEHRWAQQLASLRGASRPHPGFGSSDCDCLSHLCLLGYKPSIIGFRRRLRENSAEHHTIKRMVFALQ